MSFRRILAFPVLALVACSAGADPERVGSTGQPIVGGMPDTFRSYVVGVGDATSVFCTGTLISRRTVLTAGHCYGGITKVYFGNDVALGKGAVAVDVVKEVRHPQYNDNTLHADLTLVKLAADAPSQPAPLLRETMSNTAAWIGPNFTFVGYGNDGQFNYDTRRVAVFPIVAVGPANVGADTGTGPIDEGMFYYRTPKKNTCDGDSGGPAFAVRNGVERHAGVTSYGDGPCKVDGVDQRTDLPNIMGFIQPTIDQFEGSDPCRADGVCDESCNVGNQLVDPDCAPNHCGADGMCVLSCVDPPDPDCAPVDHCGADGVCDPSCATSDVDCLPASDAGVIGTGGAGGDGAIASSSSAGTSSSGTSTSGGGAGGEGGDMMKEEDAGAGGKVARSSDGCSAAPGGDAGDGRTALGLVALALGLARASRRRSR